MERYFAYGSNLASARLIARVPSARVESVAVLPGYRWRCNKRGRDGTAKANIEVDSDSQVWGVVYRFAVGGLALLDRHEGGYERIEVEVTIDGDPRVVETYISAHTRSDERPSASYRGFLLAGIEEHELPSGCRARVESLLVSDTEA